METTTDKRPLVPDDLVTAQPDHGYYVGIGPADEDGEAECYIAYAISDEIARRICDACNSADLLAEALAACEDLLQAIENEMTLPTCDAPAKMTPAQFEQKTVIRAARAVLAKAKR